MRLRFFQPGSEAETARFLELESNIRDFWNQFRNQQHRSPVEWLNGLRQQLAGMAPGLTLEVEQERKLYVVPWDGTELLPLADKIVEAADRTLGWTIATQRPGLPLEVALSRVASSTRFDLKAARLKIGIERGHALSIVVGHHLFQGASDELGGRAAELLVATVLGDALFDRWVSSVEVVPAPRPTPLKLVGQQDGSLPLPLEELSETITTAVSRITDTLPEQQLNEFCDRADWVLFEMSELNTSESNFPVPDLRVATTMCPEMLKSFLSGLPFASERFSRHGERFVYVELDTRGQSQSVSLEQRTALEEALDYALVPGRLGCVVGAGVGETKMYVFLALAALEPALRLITHHLQDQKVNQRTWIRFCDDEWRNEWVPAYKETPPPEE